MADILCHISFNLADGDLRKVHKALNNAHPDWLLVTGHWNPEELKEKIQLTPDTARLLEIYAHGTELSCGQVKPLTVSEIASAVHDLPGACLVSLSGCNTAVCAKPYNICQYLANAAKRRIHGVKGYGSGFRYYLTLRSTRRDPDKPRASIKPCSITAGLPDCLAPFDPLPEKKQSNEYVADSIVFSRSSLRGVLEHLSASTFLPEGSRLKISSTAKVQNLVDLVSTAIERSEAKTGRPLTAGTEAVFISESDIRYELFSNLTAVDHFGERSLLNLNEEMHALLASALQFMR